ncbi:probable serine/threonine-protein kinase DDB_G0293958 [Calliphora vicina]|uniref:probable serine/threonine-protein kinase DDB_G0293958 n=1 Tax=Calliphora vicina TaxID=7373 RepID=UPI00325AF98B
MEWQDIVNKVRLIREEFDRSYKCLNVDRPTKEETVDKHFNILLHCLEEIRIVLNVNYERLTSAHKIAAEAFFHDVKNRITTLAAKKKIEIELPDTIHEKIKIETIFSNKDFKKHSKMTQTVVEFLNTASKLINDFDGKSENLRSFIDSLQLVDSIKGEHEAVAVSIIKTKLKGTARNYIENENTIIAIINKLNNSIKGESVEVLTAKIMNIKQNNKTANAYCSEIENLTKSLESAYIKTELASKYSTQVAVKALTKNCTIDKVKIIMEAGQFNTMNDAMSKFVNSCTEATGQQNAILHYRQNSNNYRGGYNRFRGRNNYPRNNDKNSNQNNNNNNRNNYNYRNRQNYNNNNRRNRNYVNAIENESDSENPNLPLGSTQ